jgi:hypothetical protein
MMLISPIIVIGFCLGVEDWGHLGPVGDTDDVVVFHQNR